MPGQVGLRSVGSADLAQPGYVRRVLGRMGPAFRIDNHVSGVVKVVGDLDAAAARILATAMADLSPEVVDLADLRFVDSAGLVALLDARQAHPDAQFVNPSPALMRLLDITGLVEVFRLD